MNDDTHESGTEFLADEPATEPTTEPTSGSTLPITRRGALATIGGSVAALGIGGATFLASPAAAASVNIGASAPGLISNDRGDVSAVTIDPSFRIEWQNLDDAVGKIFYLIEAAAEDEDGRSPFEGGYEGDGFNPIYRATPWLGSPVNNAEMDVSKPGTTGHYEIKDSHTDALNLDPRFDSGGPPNASAHPLVVADEDGRPDYAGFDGDYGMVDDLDGFMDGTSIGGADNYPDENGHIWASDTDTQYVFQNNFPDIDAGYYGAAMGTEAIDNDVDGSQQNTTLYVRYTFELQRPNESQVGDLSNLGSGAWEHVRESDVNKVGETGNTQGNSEIVMNGEDGNYEFANPAGIPYADLQSHATDHVGVMVANAAFNVNVKNQAADAGVTGSSNTGATGGGQ